MKPFFLLLAIITSSFCLAQDVTPQSKANNKIEEIKKIVALSPDQEVKIEKALITRYEAITTFEQLHVGNKEAIKEEKKKQKKIYKGIFEKALTKEQLKQWEKYKEASSSQPEK